MTKRCSSVNPPSRGGVPVRQHTDAQDLRASVLADPITRLRLPQLSLVCEKHFAGGYTQEPRRGGLQGPAEGPAVQISIGAASWPSEVRRRFPAQCSPGCRLHSECVRGQEHPAICYFLLISIRSGSAPTPFLPQVLSICKGRWRVLPSIMNGAACVWLLTCGC